LRAFSIYESLERRSVFLSRRNAGGAARVSCFEVYSSLHNSDPHESPSELEAAATLGLETAPRTNSAFLKIMPSFLRDRLTERFALQAVLGNTSWLFWDKIIRLGSSLIVGLWIARYLGPEQFGLLNFAIAFTGLFGAIATLGMDGIVVRELVNFPGKRDDILGSAFVLRFLAAVISFVVVIGTIFILRRGETLIIRLVAITGGQFLFQSLNVIDLYFQSKVKSKYTVYATNAAYMLIAVVKVVLLLAAASLIAFVWAGLGEFVLASVFLLIAYRIRNLKLAAWRPKLGVMRDLLRDSWPLILTGISIMICLRIDQVLIGQMLNDKQVGVYSAAARISEIWYFIPLAITSSFLPLLVESKKASEALYYDRLQRFCNVQALIGIAFALFITIAAGPLTRLLYGPAYAGSAGVLRILIWGGILIPIAGGWTNWMLLENRVKTMFYFQVFGAAMNVILNLVLIPHFGILGSAYATLISYNAWVFVLCPFMKSQRKILVMMLKSLSLVWLFNLRKK
jgi:polysaccharide transporter, PST family